MQARPTIVRGLLAALFFLAICVAMAFLVVPVVAIFTHVPPGRLLHQFFNAVAVVLAICLVSAPFYIRSGIASFEAVDRNLIAASRTLGASPLRTFFKVTLPLARGGLAAGEAICMARGLGEFGATLMFAGSFQGRTQTLPLAIYTVFEANFDVALAMSALLVIISLAILLSLKMSGLWQRARAPIVPFLGEDVG